MSTQFPPVTIPNTHLRTLKSSYVDQEYRLFIGLPFGYAESEKAYPVLYLLDANMMFGAATDIVNQLSWGELELPEMIVVGIGYPVDHLLGTINLRHRDLTPTDTGLDFYNQFLAMLKAAMPTPPAFPEFVGAGEAGAFLQFIREQLMPLINSEYRTKPDDRALWGDSFGGLFGLFVLFHQPDAFNRYVIGSPSIWWDQAVTFTYESDYAANNSDLPAKVFLSVGELEEPEGVPEAAAMAMVSNVHKMADLLQERNYPSLELTKHVFEGETHSSVLPMVLSRGLKVVFAGYGK